MPDDDVPLLDGWDEPAGGATLSVREEALARTPATGIVLMDGTGVVRSWGDGAEELFGFAAGEAVGALVEDLIVPVPLRDAHRAGLARHRATGSGRRVGATLDVPVQHRDGSTFVTEMSLLAVPMDGDDWYCAVFRAATAGHREPDVPAVELIAEIFERAPEAITILDRDGHQRTVNRVGAQMLGYGPEYRHPGDGYPLIHPDDQDRIRQAANEIRGTGRALASAIRYRVLAGDGRYRWLETLAADFSDRPELGGLVAFSRDVTDDEERRQLLRESEARLRAILTALHVATAVEGPHGEVLLANLPFSELMGSDAGPEGLTGTDMAELLVVFGDRAAEPSAAREQIKRSMRLGGPSHVPAALLRDGRWIEIETVPIGVDGLIVGRFWTFRDVTDRVESEQRLRRVLEREQQARKLAEERTAQLDRLDEARTGFVAAVSHDFRTPLATILAASEFVRSDDSRSDELVVRYLDLISRNAQRLARLVDDLLVIGRLGSGRITLDLVDVDLPAVLREVVDEVRPLAAAREIELVVETTDGPPLRGDDLRLRQVVENLVANAVKYASHGTAALVSATCDGGHWSVRVTDEGPGIGAEEAALIFEPYYRADHPGAGQPGTGLGLAIVRGLVELHGGTVDVERPDDPGARFVCRLPVDGPRTDCSLT